MLLGARQFFERRGAALPYDAEVEYLEDAEGGCSIVTPMRFCDIPASCITADILIPSTANWTNRGILGSYVSSSAGYFELNTGSSAMGVALGNPIRYNFADPFKKDSRYIVVLDTSNNTVMLDGENVSLSGGMTLQYLWNNTVREAIKGATTPMRLFSNRIGSIAGLRMYGASCKVNGTLVFDFIPVRFTNELGQSEGAMYGNVSKQLFRNAGTGAFLYGPDK